MRCSILFHSSHYIVIEPTSRVLKQKWHILEVRPDFSRLAHKHVIIACVTESLVNVIQMGIIYL
jgi:hypothetical protein